MFMPKTTTTGSEAATEDLGARLGRVVVPGTLVPLYGDLGSGKTVFARGVARGLGIDEPVTSPTFPIVQTYDSGRLRLHHMDVYRLASEADALAFGMAEYLDDPHAVCVVEWAQRMPELFSTGCVLSVTIEVVTDRTRIFRFSEIATGD